MSMTLAPDTVLMAVPLPFAQQVADLIATLSAGNVSADEESVHVPEQGEWSKTMLERVAAEVSYPGVLALLDACAAHPGEWVSKETIEAAAAASPYQLRNELGAFSKRTRNMFGMVIWPMQFRRERGKYTYRLDPTIADWWTSARQGAR